MRYQPAEDLGVQACFFLLGLAADELAVCLHFLDRLREAPELAEAACEAEVRFVGYGLVFARSGSGLDADDLLEVRDGVLVPACKPHAPQANETWIIHGGVRMGQTELNEACGAVAADDSDEEGRDRAGL